MLVGVAIVLPNTQLVQLASGRTRIQYEHTRHWQAADFVPGGKSQRVLPVFIVEQNLVGMSAVITMSVHICV